ncbi:hypothetical protein [Roseiconus nitratireducens]|uniref:hypothetical protein n=1 Tax=Roseiconus nitratireducens TaxID=2605748 RepID=UPI001231856A|nr:hypothetical protein [Roseiconus nitratireducens]
MNGDSRAAPKSRSRRDASDAFYYEAAAIVKTCKKLLTCRLAFRETDAAAVASRQQSTLFRLLIGGQHDFL